MDGEKNIKTLLVLVVFLLDSCGLLRLAMAKDPQPDKAKEKHKTEAHLSEGIGGSWWIE